MWEFLSFNTTLRIFYLCGVLHFSYRTSLASGGRTCLCLQQTSGGEQRIIEQFYTLQQSEKVAGIILYMGMDLVHQNLLQWGADLRFLEHKRVTEISPIQVSFEACFQGRASGIEHDSTGNSMPFKWAEVIPCKGHNTSIPSGLLHEVYCSYYTLFCSSGSV